MKKTEIKTIPVEDAKCAISIGLDRSVEGTFRSLPRRVLMGDQLPALGEPFK
jgi:hypothetical protein